MIKIAPTEKQIRFVEEICAALGIKNFPTSSKEFNKFTYSRFISDHIDLYYQYCNYIYSMDINEDVDWVYEYTGCENDVWTEYY